MSLGICAIAQKETQYVGQSWAEFVRANEFADARKGLLHPADGGRRLKSGPPCTELLFPPFWIRPAPKEHIKDSKLRELRHL